MPEKSPEKPNEELTPWIRTFILPTLVGKMLIIYFGLNYSSYPGEGYGTGLFFTVIFTLSMFGYFLWKYRNYEE